MDDGSAMSGVPLSTGELEGPASDVEHGGDLRELERRLERLESGAAGRGMPTRPSLGGLVPDDARVHMRAATREQLLAVRSLLDHWIDRLGARAESPTRPSREDITID